MSDQDQDRLSRRGLLAAAGVGGLAATLGVDPAGAEPVRPLAVNDVPVASPSTDWIRYPPGAIAEGKTDKGVLNVQEHFFAAGDGETDDSDKIIEAINAVIDEIRDDILQTGHPSAESTQKIIYFPKGVYLVSKPLVYCGDIFPETGLERHMCLRFRGELQAETTIRLKPGAFGDKAHPQPLLCWGRTPIDREHTDPHNNTVGSNFIENLTIDTTTDNFGVRAIVMTGSNNAAIRNVTIKSGDRAGLAGIDLYVGGTQFEAYNVDITGFEVGFRQRSTYASAVAVERMTLRDQSRLAVDVTDGCASFQHLRTEGTKPGLRVHGTSAQVTVVDSAMIRTGEAEEAAIRLGAGELFARNVAVDGFPLGIARLNDTPVVTGQVTHWVSHAVTNAEPLQPQPALSLDLPVEAAPVIPWGAPDSWTNVKRFKATGDGVIDETPFIEEAFAGAEKVFFPAGEYRIERGGIRLPGTLRRVNFMFSRINVALDDKDPRSIFIIDGDASDPPLIIEDMFTRQPPDARGVYRVFEHASARTVVFSDIHLQQGPVYKSTARGGKVFFENVSSRTGGADGAPAFILNGGKQAWARWINPENGHPEIDVSDSATMRILALKKQAAGTLIRAAGGSRVELLGGMVATVPDPGPYEQNRALLECYGASMSVSLSTRAPEEDPQQWDITIRERQNGQEGTVSWNDNARLPPRGEGDLALHQRFLPLYVGRVP